MTKVAPQDWEPPDHLSLTERDFLVDRAETICGIVAKSYLEVGQVLLQVKDKFRRDPEQAGWFKSWVNETLPFSYEKANNLSLIAEAVRKDPELLDVVQTCPRDKFYKIITTQGTARELLLQAVRDGESFSSTEVAAVKQIPAVQLERLRADLESIESTVFDWEMKALTADNTYDRSNANQQARKSRERLRKANQLLADKEDEIAQLNDQRTLQEQVLQTLRKQVKQKEVVIENMSLDPEAKRKRELARTVVDATKGLDLLLETLDKYGTDREDLGPEAISTIERKMELVKQKLLTRNAIT
jgi:hypothetical protein